MATADRTTKLDDDLTVSAIGFGAMAPTTVYGRRDDYYRGHATPAPWTWA